MHAIDVNDQKDLLLDRLVEFDTSNKSLRKLLRAQQAHEVEPSISTVPAQLEGYN